MPRPRDMHDRALPSAFTTIPCVCSLVRAPSKAALHVCSSELSDARSGTGRLAQHACSVAEQCMLMLIMEAKAANAGLQVENVLGRVIAAASWAHTASEGCCKGRLAHPAT